MKLILNVCSVIFIIGLFSSSCYGLQCEQENIFGITTYKECPGLLDNKEAVFCCGPEDDRQCCETPFGDIKELAENLPTILGIIFAVVVSLIVACIVCCCCCPFCMLYKRRTRGVVHNPVPVQAQMQPVMNAAPAQPGYAPVQSSPYPPQPYPAQPGYAPPPQGFGAQPVNAGPYPTSAAPYPTQPMNPGGVENPPPYSEKQMAYNPNY